MRASVAGWLPYYQSYSRPGLCKIKYLTSPWPLYSLLLTPVLDPAGLVFFFLYKLRYLDLKMESSNPDHFFQTE